MSSRRVLKAAEAIREVVSTAILIEIRDPRVKNVTVTRVEVTKDMRNAKVYVSVRGDEGQEKLCLRGLSNSAGFLQQQIAARIDTRYIPRLSFEIDEGLKNSVEVARILQEVRREQQENEESAESKLEDPPTADTRSEANEDDQPSAMND